MRRFIPFLPKPPLVSVVRLSGTIGTGRSRLSDEATAPLIERAFRKGKPAAVALLINSPGGSPVQSSLIAARIRRLAAETATPVYAFVEDVAASGGYWLACAADEIWVDRSSIIGSIGVISSSFGLHEFIAKQGIERRVYTSGDNKSTLDMFQPEKADDVARIKVLQAAIHKAFIEHVQASRKERLSTDKALFTGEFWDGARGIELGLADGIGHVVPTMKGRFGDKVRFVVYGPKRGWFDRLGRIAAEGALQTLEERADLARFGL